MCVNGNDFFYSFRFAPLFFPLLSTWSQGLRVHRHKSAFDSVMWDIPNTRDCPYLYRFLCQAQQLEWVSQQPLWPLLSPSLDGTESKPDDPSAAAVLDGGAVASATDGMEDVVVLEPEAAAGVAAAHTTWTLPQALGVVTVTRCHGGVVCHRRKLPVSYSTMVFPSTSAVCVRCVYIWPQGEVRLSNTICRAAELSGYAGTRRRELA